jgi:hypothetical protein
LAVEQDAIIHVLISLSVLLFTAKIFAELFNKLKPPAIFAELLAGPSTPVSNTFENYSPKDLSPEHEYYKCKKSSLTLIVYL